MQYRELGKSGIRVSTVAIGCWAMAGDQYWGPQDESQALAALRTALDVGINFFDTAELYGDGYSEELIGKALEGRRREAVIASKASNQHLSGPDLRRACQASLRRLRTDYLDLYQIHWPSRQTPLSETVAALEALQREGTIRAYGVSNFGPGDLDDLLALTDRAVSNQVPYSLLWRAIEFAIQPKCVAHGIGILPYSPLAMGLLTGKFATADDVPAGRARTRHFSKDRPGTRHGEPGCEAETFAALSRIRQIADSIGQPMADVALAWLLSRPGVTAVVAGARDPAQVRENARAADLSLPPAILQALTEATEPLKQRLGPNPDMWQSESRYR